MQLFFIIMNDVNIILTYIYDEILSLSKYNIIK